MPLLLVALDGGPDIPMGREPIVVGRHPHCDVRLRSIRVSRRHCCLTEVDGAVIVRDLGSTNWTMINGRRVEAGRLRPGDELSIAHLRYRLEQGQAGRARADGSQPGVREDSPWPTDPPGTSLFDPGRMGVSAPFGDIRPSGWRRLQGDTELAPFGIPFGRLTLFG